MRSPGKSWAGLTGGKRRPRRERERERETSSEIREAASRNMGPTSENPGSTPAPEAKLEVLTRTHQNWVTHWQEFLMVPNTPHSGRGNNPQRTDPWGDSKAFLVSFEQVAEACRWPREEWAARLLPALSGEAEQAFHGLGTKDKEDYGKVKAAILRGETLRMETQRQRFRRFQSQEAEDPRRVYSQLRELCHQWLKPEKHTKEQILEFLILEQFLASLPAGIQEREHEGGPPEDGVQTVALTEDFLVNHQEAEMEKWQGPFHEVVVEIEENPAGENYSDVEEEEDQDPASVTNGLSPHSHLMAFPSEEVTDAESPEVCEVLGPVNLDSVAFSLNQAGQTTLNPARMTMYWEVKQDNYKLNNFKEGLLIPKPNIFSTEQEPDVVFVQSSGNNQEAFPASDSGDDVTQNLAQFRKIILGKEGDGQNMLTKISEGRVAEAFEMHQQESESESTSFPWRQRSEGKHGEPPGFVEIHTTPTSPTKPASFFSSEAGGMYCFKPGLVTDQMTQTGESSYECQVCERIFQNKSRLTRHERIHTGEKPYKCTECDKAFGRKDKLVGHQRTHNAVKKPLEAFDFGKDLSVTDTLIQQQSPYSEMRPYRCSECGKTFALNSLLRRHQQVHSAKKPYECSKCRRRFRWISAMKRHQKTHERLFECLECGKTFNQIEALYRHHTVHTGERRYKCSQCGQGFDQRENMLRHEKIHTEEKYPCSGCEKSFSRKDTMMRHQRIHTGENRTIKEETDYD